ncbi:MAG: response regulator transcription factor [Eubacterium sp.]|nr:response regulator transcription factor [Eubacterium sp.]
MKLRILIAEDEKDLARAVSAVLTHQGYQVVTAADGQEAVDLAMSGAYDCMIFDIMMPRMDGIEALRRIRDGGDMTPVIILTAKAEVDDRVEGLDAGADDYLTKPFSMKELMARIRSMTRRNTSYTPTRLSVGSVRLDTEIQELSSHNSIRLARKETLLMEYLMLNQGKALSTEDIFTRVWKDEKDVGQDIVWVYISYLRQKLIAVRADLEIQGENGGSFLLQPKAGES